MLAVAPNDPLATTQKTGQGGERNGHLVVDVGVVLGLLLVDKDGSDDDGGEGDVEPAAKRGQKARGGSSA